MLACPTFPGMAPLLVQLRPSNEHILIVRVPGAKDQQGYHSSFLPLASHSWTSYRPHREAALGSYQLIANTLEQAQESVPH